MVIASRALAFARRAGKAQTALKWIKMHYNVFLTVPDMALSIWTRKRAPANRDGLVKTVLEVFVNCSFLKFLST